jgi:hypothetical protein
MGFALRYQPTHPIQHLSAEYLVIHVSRSGLDFQFPRGRELKFWRSVPETNRHALDTQCHIGQIRLVDLIDA